MAEQIEEDKASWAEVQVTAIFTAATSAIFLGIFEIARRNPSISSVFDRRRKSKPHRTPPPLLRNTIFEWLFLSNEPRYSEYSDLCHMRDVISERRRQRSARRKRGNGSPDSQISNDYPNDSTRAVGGAEMTNRPNKGVPKAKLKVQRYLTPDVVEVNGRRLPVEVADYALANDLTEAQLMEYEEALVRQEMQDEMEFHRRVKAMKLQYETKGRLFSKRPNDNNNLDDEENQNEPEVFNFDESKKLELPARPSRLFCINFQQGILTGKKSAVTSPRLKTLTPKSLFSRMWSVRNVNMGSPVTAPSSPNSPGGPEVNEDLQINRHLKTKATEQRPLVQSDAELLRCIGLDTFVMIRFLRFCFDVTFYPFLLSLLLLVPTYYNNNYDGIQFEEGLIIETQTDGYFRYTMNRLESGSTKIWVPFGFTICFVFFILRRHWIEWETFIALRLDFMANGDVENEERREIEGSYSFKSRKLANPKDDVQLHLEQYRNSCIVEYIPESHRRDKELYQFFDAIFPGQVKRAEIVLNASYLAGLVKQRQKFIEKYESVYAKFQHSKQKYFYRKEGILVDGLSVMYCLKCKCFRDGLKTPQDPTMSIGRRFFCCGGRKVKALPYLLSEIKRLNVEIEKEHKKISQSKIIAEDRDEDRDIITTNLAGAKTFITGTTQELTCDTGFVEFKNLTTKQSALQCNLTGTDGHMLTESAPDPRDMKWENAAVERRFIRIKKLQCDALLFTGTLFWAGVVSTITGFSDIDQLRETIPGFPDWLVPKDDSVLSVALQGYLPVVLLELLMLPVPILLKLIATRFIRFKTHSEIDYFVYKWHFAYRVANLIIIIVRHQVLKTFRQILKNPQAAIGFLTSSIASSSQFFLNNMLLAAGTETLFELAQIPRIMSHFILHRIITIEAASKRTVERLQSPISLEWGDVVPKFIFALLIAAVYSATVPVVTGVCAIFFYLSTKVYTHQALFIYAQPYEGGGKLMYQLNRSVFTIVYTTVNIFAILLALKDQNATAVSFFIIMNLITFLVDRQVRKKFIKPGLTLALVNARIIDEQNKLDEERSRLFEEYKKAKLAKRREAALEARAAKKLNMQNYRDLIASKLLPPLGRHKSEDEGFADSPPSIKRTRFQLDETTSSKFRPEKSHHHDDVSDDDSMEDMQDFYLYRQPELNKALWETKPRAYMD